MLEVLKIIASAILSLTIVLMLVGVTWHVLDAILRPKRNRKTGSVYDKYGAKCTWLERR